MKTVVHLSLALLTVALLATPSPAGDCVRVRGVCFSQPAYMAPVYVAQMHQTVVPHALPVYVQQPYIFSAISEQTIAESAAWKTLVLLQGQQGAGISGARQRIMPQADQPVPPQAPRANLQQGAASTAVDPKLQAVVTKSCVACHNQAKPGGGLDLTELATVSEYHRLKSLVKVNRGEMPLKQDPLPDAEVQLFDAWAKSIETVKR